ncbi:DinB family protein [Pseudoduganella ginsengisoli]|uniref:Damage-inducible protein DinB n=1 Tax=Pseudoduganella ginsengisoli TaxID=1462440 RepID=A0A6L6Q1H5_9BURK|nr:DinB family protein [Pseudoduganella ginsengisoli]MTW02892.1 damage-inducible protein DinB [Pseudoduganella ginsengisoli]
MSVTMLQSLFGQKAWANSELFDVLATVTAEADLHMAIRTLNHIYVVDRIFRAHLLGEAHGYDATNTKATPTLEELRAAVKETDAWFQGYVATLDDAALAQPVQFRFTDGDAGTMSREEILMHVITHGGYHRGNVGQILKNISVAPPRDLLTKYLHVAEPQRRAV